MSNLFTFLFILSLVGFIIGLINPKVLSRFIKKDLNRKNTSVFFGLCIIIFLIFAGVFSAKDVVNNSNNNLVEQNEIIFDLESLYGKNIDEIKIILGEPTDDTEPQDVTSEYQLFEEWSKSWEKGDWGLLVEYDVASREVIDFFLSTDDPSGKTRDIKRLEESLNIKGSNNFSIKPVEVLVDPSYYTGIIAIPKK
jgi:hypothetical protein